MADSQSPNDELFSRRSAPRPLLTAVTELAATANYTLEEMEALTMGQISALAQETYGANLPKFWQTWIDWSHDQSQPTGEL